MRIVLLNQYYAPDEAATAQLLTDLGSGLVAAGHEVRAVCSRRAYAAPSTRYPARGRVDGVSVRRVRCTGFGRGSGLGRLIDYASFLVGASVALVFGPRPDVVVSLSTPPMVALLGLIVARLRSARSLYWVMDVYPDLAFELGVLRRGAAAGGVFSAMSRYLLRRSDAVVALGETMGRRLESAGGVAVHVIHNWADGESIRPRPNEGNVLRAEWGWGRRFVALYSGNLGLAHEFDTVLDAAALLRERDDIVFAFVGDGPRRAEVETAIRERGLANVELRPYVPRARLGDSLTAGDVHLVTLRPGMQGLLVPSKIYGVLAAGRPTVYVGPDEGEIHDIVAAGCGSRLAVGDAPGLARVLAEYAADPSRRAAEGERARCLFDERFAKRHALAAFRTLIEAQVGAA